MAAVAHSASFTVGDLIALLEVEKVGVIEQRLRKDGSQLPSYALLILRTAGWNPMTKLFNGDLTAEKRTKTIEKLKESEEVDSDNFNIDLDILSQARLVVTDKRDFKVLLLGRTWAGKSELGDALLRKTVFSPGNNTTKVQKGETVQGEYKLVVYDTPGVFGNNWHEGKTVRELLAKEDFDVVLIVAGEAYRFNKGDITMLEQLTAILPSVYLKKLVVVCTRAFDEILSTSDPNKDSLGPREAFKETCQLFTLTLKRLGGDTTKLQFALADTAPRAPRNANGDIVLPDGEAWMPELFDLMRSVVDVNASIALFGYLNAGPYTGSLAKQKMGALNNLEAEARAITKAAERSPLRGLQHLRRLRIGIKKVKSNQLNKFLTQHGDTILLLIRKLGEYGGRTAPEIFRVPPNELTRREFTARLLACNNLKDAENLIATMKSDLHVICSTIKALLREAQPTRAFMTSLLATADAGFSPRLIASFINSPALIPPKLCAIWIELCGFLWTTDVEKTKMSHSAFATCISASMIVISDARHQTVVETFVLQLLSNYPRVSKLVTV